MSGLLGAAAGLLPAGLGNAATGAPAGALPGWRNTLRPASFRGAKFFVTEHDFVGGRRVASFEFPFRDDGYTEDLGRRERKIAITAFVIGPEYPAARDALLKACEDTDEPGLLVHPFKGEIKARCSEIAITESLEEGGFARIRLLFVPAGKAASPVERVDPRPAVLRQVGQALSLAREAFAWVSAAQDLGGFLAGAGVSYLTGFGERLAADWLGLPGLDLTQVRGAIAALTGAGPDDDAAAVAATLTAPASALAAAPALVPAAPGAGRALTSRGEGTDPARAADLLLDLADYADPRPRVTGTGTTDAAEAAGRAAIEALARDAAVAAAIEAAARADWPSAAAATAARRRLLDALDVRALAAGDAGQDDLYAAWRDLAAAAARDLDERARRLPQLGTYATPRGLPALALAHRLHQDAGRADELVALNATPHPAMMPATGARLVP